MIIEVSFVGRITEMSLAKVRMDALQNKDKI